MWELLFELKGLLNGCYRIYLNCQVELFVIVSYLSIYIGPRQPQLESQKSTDLKVKTTFFTSYICVCVPACVRKDSCELFSFRRHHSVLPLTCMLWTHQCQVGRVVTSDLTLPYHHILHSRGAPYLALTGYCWWTPYLWMAGPGKQVWVRQMGRVWWEGENWGVGGWGVRITAIDKDWGHK